jgi:hypothetical protein
MLHTWTECALQHKMSSQRRSVSFYTINDVPTCSKWRVYSAGERVATVKFVLSSANPNRVTHTIQLASARLDINNTPAPSAGQVTREIKGTQRGLKLGDEVFVAVTSWCQWDKRSFSLCLIILTHVRPFDRPVFGYRCVDKLHTTTARCDVIPAVGCGSQLKKK